MVRVGGDGKRATMNLNENFPIHTSVYFSPTRLKVLIFAVSLMINPLIHDLIFTVICMYQIMYVCVLIVYIYIYSLYNSLYTQG